MTIELRRDFKLEDATLTSFSNLNGEERGMVRNWRNAEGIRKWMYTDHVISPEEHGAFLKRAESDGRNFYWVVRGAGGEYLGVMSLNRVDERNRNAYFAIYSNPDCKTPGIGRTMDRMAIRLAFEFLGLHTLRLEVIEDNAGVINLHRKMGFKEEGRLKGFVFKDGRFKDVVVMGMVNAEEGAGSAAEVA